MYVLSMYGWVVGKEVSKVGLRYEAIIIPGF